MINQTDIKIGEKYEVVQHYSDKCTVGDIIEVTGLDCDNWPYIRNVRTGRTDLVPTSRFCEAVKKHNEAFSNKWIAWNVHGSVMAESEEEVKSKAEGILNQMPHQPVYVAQAQKMAKINAVVWTE